MKYRYESIVYEYFRDDEVATAFHQACRLPDLHFASAVGLTAIALAVSYAVTLSAASSLALATVAGPWLALLFAPGVACLTSWHKLREPMGGRS